MKKIISLFFILLVIVSTSSKSFASNNSENVECSNRSTWTFWFKTIPPKKHKGKKLIDYFPNSGGYTGIYF